VVEIGFELSGSIPLTGLHYTVVSDKKPHMNRQQILTSLIHFNAPLADLEADLAALGWGNDPEAVLQREHIKALLNRYTTGEIDAASVEIWANLIEGRDDIQFEPGHEEIVLTAIHDLANPALQGKLETIVWDVLASLNGHQ